MRIIKLIVTIDGVFNAPDALAIYLTGAIESNLTFPLNLLIHLWQSINRVEHMGVTTIK